VETAKVHKKGADRGRPLEYPTCHFENNCSENDSGKRSCRKVPFNFAIMISMIMVLNQKGEIMISRQYRDDVSRVAADSFRIQVS
jgi:hypothetical protein